MEVQERRETPLDLARFSFSMPTREAVIDDSLGIECGEDGEEENPRGIAFEPCKMEEQSERSIGSTQFSLPHRKQPSMDPAKEQYGNPHNLIVDSMLDTLMDSISQVTKRPESDGKPLPKGRIKSLEMRLAGTRQALRTVEKELKEKNKVIEHLHAELQRKPKVVVTEAKENNIDNGNRTQESVSEFRKREKQYEKRLQESEATAQQNKKYMIRLQELNQSLLAKVRSSADENKQLTRDLETSQENHQRQLKAATMKLEQEKSDLEK